jgi:hypothetical protein
MKRVARLGIAALVLVVAAGCSSSPAADEPAAPGTLAYDRGVFHGLLEEHAKIRRTVAEVEGGVEARTESDDPRVAGLLKDHVMAMKGRIETGRRLRQWDPLYVAVFDHAEKIRLEVTPVEKGVVVRETSGDPEVAALIRAHAGVVSAFAARGFDESAEAHAVPGK